MLWMQKRVPILAFTLGLYTNLFFLAAINVVIWKSEVYAAFGTLLKRDKLCPLSYENLNYDKLFKRDHWDCNSSKAPKRSILTGLRGLDVTSKRLYTPGVALFFYLKLGVQPQPLVFSHWVMQYETNWKEISQISPIVTSYIVVTIVIRATT